VLSKQLKDRAEEKDKMSKRLKELEERLSWRKKVARLEEQLKQAQENGQEWRGKYKAA